MSWMIPKDDQKKWITEIDNLIHNFPNHIISNIIIDYLLAQPYFETNLKWTPDVIISHKEVKIKTDYEVVVPLQMNLYGDFRMMFNITGHIHIILAYLDPNSQSNYPLNIILYETIWKDENLQNSDVIITGKRCTFYEEFSIILFQTGTKRITYHFPLDSLSNARIFFETDFIPTNIIRILNLPPDSDILWTKIQSAGNKVIDRTPLFYIGKLYYLDK